MISAVFDCMIFLQALTSKQGVGAACIDLVDDGRVHLFLSPEVLDELIRVFHRPSTRRQFPYLPEEKIDEFLSRLTASCVILKNVPVVAQVPRDPKDEPYLNLALAAQASFLVTRDKDLLALMDDAAFRKRHPALSIVDPKVFLDHVRAEIALE